MLFLVGSLHAGGPLHPAAMVGMHAHAVVQECLVLGASIISSRWVEYTYSDLRGFHSGAGRSCTFDCLEAQNRLSTICGQQAQSVVADVPLPESKRGHQRGRAAAYKPEVRVRFALGGQMAGCILSCPSLAAVLSLHGHGYLRVFV
jgi:hypothetical protein